MTDREGQRRRTAVKTVDDEVDSLIDARQPVVREIYDRLIDSVRGIGRFQIEPKKTCIHLATDVAFAGIHPRANTILLNLRTTAAIASPRVRKCDQASRNRFHNEILLESPGDIDADLIGWVERAFELASS